MERERRKKGMREGRERGERGKKEDPLLYGPSPINKYIYKYIHTRRINELKRRVACALPGTQEREERQRGEI